MFKILILASLLLYSDANALTLGEKFSIGAGVVGAVIIVNSVPKSQ